MKKIILFLLLSLFLYSFAYAQRNEKRDPGKKIEALEKIKLLEALDLNEETAIKFFARRNEHKEKMKDLFGELNAKHDKIKDKVSAVKDDNDPELKELVDDYFKTEMKLDEERKRFLNSLADILTYKQIAELTLFERRFREEIRDVLFHHKKKKRIDREQY